MPPLIPCPACARHVYSSEAECPFCQAAMPRPRAVGKGLAAAAGASLALLASGCPGDAKDGGQPPATVDTDPGGDRGPAAAEYGAPPPPADPPQALDPGSGPPPDREPGEVYGAPAPPDDLDGPVPPDFRDDLQAEYGAPPPPPPDDEPPRPR
ncbi:MAG: hypothetical protein KDD82_03295 [Planctomycetes bacterium]|nr:hypothetical protein [Planctomycetota bacterium]